MKNTIRKKYLYQIPFLLLGVFFLCLIPARKAGAEGETAVSVGKIDYDKLTVQIFNHENNRVYYSTDKSTWMEVEAPYDNETKSYSMDISWISATKEFTLYLKGDQVKTVISLLLPEQNNFFEVSYDKADNTFAFYETEDADTFQWRKASDYTWNTVDMSESSASYMDFIDTMEGFRTMGAQIYFRIPQVIGTDNEDTGYRPSKEVSVTIAKRSSAPSVKVYSSKLYLNTTDTMEYYDISRKTWVECDKSMKLEDIAPEVLHKNGSHNATIMIRKAATTTATYSKTAYLEVKGQSAAPEIGDNKADLTYYYMNSKLILQFHKASETEMYEYAVVKKGFDFDLNTARWITVKSSKAMTISKTTAPEGCTIYVRKKGTDANASTKIDLILSSATNSFKVTYPESK